MSSNTGKHGKIDLTPNPILPMVTAIEIIVTPVKTGVQIFSNFSIFLDSRFRGNDKMGVSFKGFMK